MTTLCRLGLYAIPLCATTGVYGLLYAPPGFWTILAGVHLIGGAFAAWSACWEKAGL